MSKISCNVIQDIMPLYVDEIVSEDTKKLVEEHLKECEDCRKEMEKMRAKIILPNKKKINQAEKELFQKLKHRLINRRIAAAILGAILVCALLAGVYTCNSGRGSRKKGNCNGLFKSKPVVHIYTTSFARAERR